MLEAAGWPLDQTSRGFSRWERHLEEASQFPNVTLKLQGLALVFGPSAETLQPWVRTALRTFGPTRCMFATHFPVDRLLWSFDEMLSRISEILEGVDTKAQEEFFSGCARKVYRLP